MQISFSSKTVQLTDEVKLLAQTKLERLGKFTSLKIEQFQVIVDRVKRGAKTTSEAQVEVIAKIKGKQFAFKEVGENLHQALYRALDKVEEKLGKEASLHDR
ncbi:MAG TPA: ribosome-associated translation inhibitor RaiA [Candidatus Saccharimonadia bacterium]|nr:ribosome-associated translation inhibitor RaiA [Candidatus Saccharimonadia bacterium]